MIALTRIRWSICCASLAALTGCGGGGGFATEPGESVLVDTVTSFTLVSSGGGFGGPPPQGACDPQVWTYTVHLASAAFTWDRCDVNGGTSPVEYVPSAGTRTLSATELEMAKAAARQVHVSGRTDCGADKPTLHLSVTSPAGTMAYGDDFYACLKQELVYVDFAALGNLETVLQALVLPTR